MQSAGVYDSTSTQAALFEASVAPVVDEVLRGYSCTVFAYGQTGTGKTYTMEGVRREDGTLEAGADSADAGIIARAVRRVFAALERAPEDSHVKISFLEIYNERLDDLLAAEPSAFMADAAARAPAVGKSGKERELFGDGVSAPGAGGGAGGAGGAERLKIVDDKRAGIKVQNLEEVPVFSADEVFGYVSRGIAKRATAETACNAQSSRSHCVFTLTIHMREMSEAGEDVIKIGKLNLVDLAGSECVGRSGAKDARAREAGNINQSLLTLGRVITALVDKLPHVPYRDSKLTRLLQDSLGACARGAGRCVCARLAGWLACVPGMADWRAPRFAAHWRSQSGRRARPIPPPPPPPDCRRPHQDVHHRHAVARGVVAGGDALDARVRQPRQEHQEQAGADAQGGARALHLAGVERDGVAQDQVRAAGGAGGRRVDQHAGEGGEGGREGSRRG